MIKVSLIALALLMIIAAIIWKNYKLFFALPVFYSAYTKTISVFYLETEPLYLTETGIFTSDIGAAWRHLFF